MLIVCSSLGVIALVILASTPAPGCFCWFCKKYRKVQKFINNSKEKINGYIKRRLR